MKSKTKNIFHQINARLVLIGLNPIRFIGFLRGLMFYFNDLRKLKKQKGRNIDFHFATCHPILNERFSNSGITSGHYFHQDLLVAQRIFKNNPKKHVDIGSRVDGFVAHVATFRTIEVFDIRPQKCSVNNIVSRQVDLMDLPNDSIDYCDSISSLHAIEHFGLGRYGDPVNYYGHIKAISNIYKLLTKESFFIL